MKIKPIGDNIVVKGDSPETISAGGIVLPGADKNEPTKGTVVAVGPGKADKKGVVKPINLKEGDTVIFVKGTGKEVKLDEEQFIFLKEEHIIAIHHN